MRLARPVYETLPLIYAAIGIVAISLAYLDADSPRSAVAMVIGLVAEVAAVTIFLRRQDYRELRREYTGETIDFPSRLNR
jgi:hypothetical protein